MYDVYTLSSLSLFSFFFFQEPVWRPRPHSGWWLGLAPPPYPRVGAPSLDTATD